MKPLFRPALLLLLCSCCWLSVDTLNAKPLITGSFESNPAPSEMSLTALTPGSSPPSGAHAAPQQNVRRDPPPNDLCEEAEVVTDPYPVSVTGSMTDATVDCPGLLDWDAVWYAIELPYDGQHLAIDWCDTPAAITEYGVIYMDDCNCDNYVVGNYSWNCENGNVTITWEAVPGPATIYFPHYVVGATGFTINIDVTEFFPIPGNYCDTPFIAAQLPYGFSGTTSDNTHTYGGQSAPDEWHRFTMTETAVATISLCNDGTTYDSWIWLLAADCETEIAQLDDSCGLQSEIIRELTPGDYMVCISGYGNNSGSYQLDITLPPPCDITCPPFHQDEGEVDCFDGYFDVVNGGCDSEEPIYGELVPGMIVCGTSGTFLTDDINYRDTDWYRFSLTDSSRVTCSGDSEFPAQLMLLNAADCDSLQLFHQFNCHPCELFSSTAILPPGQFALMISPTRFSGVPCGSEYYLQLNVGDMNSGETIQTAIPIEPDDCVNGNTTAFIDDYDEACPSSSTSPDIVYSLQMDYVADVLFNMCESGYDTKLFVYNQALELVGCSDDDCEDSQGNPYRSFIEILELPTDHYYIVCDGWNGAAGEFELCVEISNPQGVEPEQAPEMILLLDNYPNPFNPVTSIRYHLTRAADVQLKVYNIRGEAVSTLVEELQPAGEFTVQFDGGELASGIYFYRLTAGEFTQTNRMLLVK